MPECLINPERSPLCEAIHHPVVLDTPDHEDDAGDNSKDQCFGKMVVKGELDMIFLRSKSSCGSKKRRENPPG